jgi:hypothetical protein
VISIERKKKTLTGDYKNSGSDYRPQGCPDEVKVHDFVDKELGKAIPYGIYDIASNTGWVSVGVDHDTAEFAVNAVRSWYASRRCRRRCDDVRLANAGIPSRAKKCSEGFCVRVLAEH